MTWRQLRLHATVSLIALSIWHCLLRCLLHELVQPLSYIFLLLSSRAAHNLRWSLNVFWRQVLGLINNTEFNNKQINNYEGEYRPSINLTMTLWSMWDLWCTCHRWMNFLLWILLPLQWSPTHRVPCTRYLIHWSDSPHYVLWYNTDSVITWLKLWILI